MQNQELVYRIGKTILPREQKYAYLFIYVILKDGCSDELSFHWHYEPGTEQFTRISTMHHDYKLNDLLNKMRDGGISIHCQPEEVIQFLEKNDIRHAMPLDVNFDGEKTLSTVFITEKEIKSRTFKRKEQVFKFLDDKKNELLQRLKDERDIETQRPW